MHPPTEFDFMSYCGPQWVSLHNHALYLTAARFNPVVHPVGMSAGAASARFDLLCLAGRVDEDGNVRVDSVARASLESAATAGALEANIKLLDIGWPHLSQLTLVELYLERAGEAWRALQQQELAAPNRLRLVGKVQFGQGVLRRSLDSSYRGASYDFISALTDADPKGKPLIAYRLDTKRARTEVRAQKAQATLLRNLVREASNDANTDPLIGRTLFNLLIPVEVEPFLGGSSEMVIELDRGTASIPWELLDTNPDAQDHDRKPWAIRSALVRKLQIEEFRAHVTDASADDNVLVIGEPLCDETRYPRLEGARREAIAVAKRLSAPGSGIAADKVKSLVDRNDAQTIINDLFERPYRVVHVAGHGEYSEDGGVVLSGDSTVMGANEVRAMRTVPELVFLNCCHVAGREAATALAPYDRAAFAAILAADHLPSPSRLSSAPRRTEAPPRFTPAETSLA